MCGIVGLVAFDAPAPRAEELVAAMAERIRHRGPDGGGVIAHPDATLGMTRLAIIDVEHGRQPMPNDDGSIVLVFNGEIYNAPELRGRLTAEGVSFRTRSDTEVILRLYERDPERVEEHLAGMWAFAIHDRRRRRLVLSRDRLGIKPLYVVEAGGSLAFGSELRAFDRSLEPFRSRFGVSRTAAHAMLSWNFVPENVSIFEGVRKLPPASRVEVDLATGAQRATTYWSLTPDAEAARVRSLDEACEGVEARLRRSVREHLESDVPIATFLSGGVDSSLVTGLAADETKERVKAFTIGFAEPRFDESPFARKTARRLGIDIEVTMLDEKAALRSLGDALVAYDEPFGDTSSIGVNLLCERVSRDYKVALGGDGGDEAFAGYKKHLIMRLRRPFARVPGVRDALGRALGRIPTRTDRTRAWTELLRTVRRLARGLEGTDAQIYSELTQVAPLARTSALVIGGADGAGELLSTLRARFEQGEGSGIQRTLAGDLSNTLPNGMLVKVDRASMAHHLEVRVPFLDHRLVEYGVGLPDTYTLGRTGKVVLRALHERRFGAELARRPKRGFGVPVETWLRGPLDGACARLFDRSRLERWGVLDPAALADGKHREWVRTDPMVAWHAFALAAWCEATLGDGPDAVRAIIAAAPASR